MRQDVNLDRKWMMATKSGRYATQGEVIAAEDRRETDRQKSDAYYGVMRI